ncbi:aspartate aminotransferase, cytoplasmic-like [Zootermopsis nevadensis]|uniref:aspartate aminotransferase, cytoplasmic-like n=1 Tax=Zootermopsis nevadensis TaxID=136037 RepID=UPI000B8E40F7|nr:aspartate aminotransferase, cytoplasmic-like [Zootermopsis nevadensis]
MKPRFQSVPAAESIPIVVARDSCVADLNENKVDLVVGAYRTAEGEPWVMPFVKKIEQKMANDPKFNHEYLWFLGQDKFNTLAPRLVLGDRNPAILERRAFGVQTLSGTGALRMGAEFLVRHLHYKTIYMPSPTWDNHALTFHYSGFKDLHHYRYWDPARKGVNFDGMLEDVRKAPENSVILLHMAAHNPTGCDLTREQWTLVADVMEKRNLFPFIDAAYQGYATGDLDRDAWPVRYLADRGFELFVSQSFSKNMALYGERIGCLTVVLAKGRSEDATNILSQLTLIARATYISPPKYGAEIVTAVLSDPELMEEWKKCLRVMVDRVLSMRSGLRERLEKMETPGDWEYITNQIGMFSFLGLTPRQVEYIRIKHHVHMLSNGRANMCGLNDKNIDKVAEAIHDTVTKVHD